MKKALFLLTLCFLCNNVFAQEEDSQTENRLLSALLFFKGYHVGSDDAVNGPKVSLDRGKTWKAMSWPETKGFGLDVGPQGKMIYAAVGNGVLRSRDGGQTWILCGGWELTETQEVRMDPKNPKRAWAASAWGLFFTIDEGLTWTKPEDQPFGFASTLSLDVKDPSRLLVGTEEGIFITDERCGAYQRVGEKVPIRSLIQDQGDPCCFWAATDGAGLMRSQDRGLTWRRVPNTPKVCFRIVQTKDLLLLGSEKGVCLSPDHGTTWTFHNSGFGPKPGVYALAADPELKDRLYAGCRDGFYESRDNGKTWTLQSQKDGIIQDLYFGKIYTGPPETLSVKKGELKLNLFPPQGKNQWAPWDKTFQGRVERLKEKLLDRKYKEKLDAATALTFIREGKLTKERLLALEKYLDAPGHSMFHSIPCLILYFYGKDFLSDGLQEKLRRYLVENHFYRGDTENHWVMHYVSLLLTAQNWPETSCSQWYTGRATQENYDEALGWLNLWFDTTARFGKGEFDSPAYFTVYMTPMLLLFDFAKDPVIKRKAGMMLDLLLADMANDSLEGRFCGGHSRAYDRHVQHGNGDQDNWYFYLYCGGIDTPKSFHPWHGAVAYSAYRCPEPVTQIALRRDKPLTQVENKRVRNIMRYALTKHCHSYHHEGITSPPVFKTSHMTSSYCIGSLEGGILQPLQQHTWDVTWISKEVNSTLFTLHPYWSGYELAMFFPEDPHYLTDSVQSQKKTYTNPNKWTSSSPYERVFQDKNILIALYDIPEDVQSNHADLYCPKCLDHEEKDGWILGQDNGFYVGVFPLKKGEWITEDKIFRLRVYGGRAAFVCVTGCEKYDLSFEKFCDNLLHGPKPKYDGAKVRYNDMVCSFESPRKKSPEYLFKGPLMESKRGSGVIRIFGQNQERILDFSKNRVTVKERGGD